MAAIWWRLKKFLLGKFMGTEGQLSWICTSCNLYVLHIALSHSSSSYWVLMYKQFNVQLFEEKKLITFCMKEDIIDWQLMENIRMHSQPKLSHQSNYSALITQKIECIQWLALTELCTILHWIWRWKLSEAWTWIFIQRIINAGRRLGGVLKPQWWR